MLNELGKRALKAGWEWAELNELGKRALKAGWERAEGAIDLHGDRVVDVCGPYVTILSVGDVTVCVYTQEVMSPPDFSDPATKGCLLDQVRKRLGQPEAFARTVTNLRKEKYWVVWAPGLEDVGSFGRGATEAEALVSALENVTKREE